MAFDRRLLTAVGVGAALSMLALVTGAVALESDDGLHVLAGYLYGVPFAMLAAGVVAGARAARKPMVRGVVAAELAWLLCLLLLLPFAPSLTFVLAGVALAQFLVVPIWAIGAVGGWAGKKLWD